MINFDLIINSLPNLLAGASLTLVIGCTAFIIGIILGGLLGFLHLSKNPLINNIVTLYVVFIRGTPMLLHILLIFYVLPQFGLRLSGLFSAIIAIGLNSSAYISQIIKSGLLTIPKGQIEAAKVLGFTSLQIAIWIKLPLVVRAILPTISNEIVTLIKDSSLASIIGVMELTKVASIIKSRTYDSISILLAIAVIYLIITSILTFLLNKLGRKLRLC